MAATQIYFASPSGAALTLSMQSKIASAPSHGMYRAEIDARQFITGRSAAELLDSHLKQMKGAKHLLIGIHAGPKVALDAGLFVRIGENKKSVIYRVEGGIPHTALESLTNLPYGEFFVVGYAGVENLTAQLPTLTDLDAATATLENGASWVIGYDNESAVMTTLAREADVLRDQIMGALERNLSAL
ncbi:MAG: hypothetical protein IT467_12475 [Dokdonella sp.]|uniref:hypothetical protein n=1 Tax=Dokdonella sp. TaxID=2291710 RepID=UPI0025BEBDBC|nr:hypothetical protein [Dokdonella sp.]MBZ0223077.1 hypothetical protein [Dokdonella sp.]MCC7256735.1 hypothetical protein [Dokdonella sp.]